MTKSSFLLSKPQTPENSKVAHDMEVKPKDFKVKLKDELMDDEFQNGLCAMETMKCWDTENKVRNEIELETKPKEMKVKVEPKDELETEELQNGLRVIETMNPKTLDADTISKNMIQCGHTYLYLER